MMESIREWIRDLVSIVIFAGLIEMIVPFGNMKRYVKMAMGLLILLTVLNPVLEVIHQPVNLDETARQVWASGPMDAGRILERASDIRRATEERTVEVYRQRIQSSVEAVATGVRGIGKARAVVTFGRPPSNGDVPPLAGVEVAVSPGTSSAPESRPAYNPDPESRSVNGIEPVRIGRVDLAKGTSLTPARDKGKDSGLARQVRAAVSSFLNLEESKVVVKVLETGAGGDGR